MYLSNFLGPLSLSPAHDGPMIDLCLRQAEESAAAGFAMVTFGEQHLNGYEPYCDPFLMAARLAPVLGDCWFGTTIVPLPLRPVLRLAEHAAIVDYLLNGRFLLGVSAGRGGPAPEFEVFGVDPEDRPAAFDSKLALLQAIFAHQPGDMPLDLNTKWDTGTLIGRLMPTPYRRGGPQIAVGTNTPEKIDGIARQGLPLFLGPCLPHVAAGLLARHRDGLAAAGHSGDAARKSLVTRHVIVGASSEEAWERAERLAGRNPMMDRTTDRRSLRELSTADVADRNAAHVQSWIIAGTPDEVTAQIQAYADAEIQHLNVRFTVGTSLPPDVDASFALFRDEVLPALKPQRF
ncbi:LLM class flavin-dependent oxidoreductase [Actinoplanes sp. NPDC026670]|uniref:LLM class flavin-dependent oxidoreductase n=1 Tax=Actinoplanes sp. NPDC026670 TaxID=3154700 RepID=UPI0033FD88CD